MLQMSGIFNKQCEPLMRSTNASLQSHRPSLKILIHFMWEREREKRGDTIYEVRGEITLVFSLLMEHDVKNVLSAVSLTAISRQPRETGGSLEE